MVEGKHVRRAGGFLHDPRALAVVLPRHVFVLEKVEIGIRERSREQFKPA